MFNLPFDEVELVASDTNVVRAPKPYVIGLSNGFSDVWGHFYSDTWDFVTDSENFVVDSSAADIVELHEHTFWDDRFNNYIETSSSSKKLNVRFFTIFVSVKTFDLSESKLFFVHFC